MAIRTELHLRLPNSPGALASVSRALAGERIDILALMLERTGDLRFVADNPLRAAAVLEQGRHRVTEHEVLAVELPNTQGALAPILGLLLDSGVNVEYAYSGSAGPGSSLMILGVDDALRASAATGL
jgi:hypothetical protein